MRGAIVLAFVVGLFLFGTVYAQSSSIPQRTNDNLIVASYNIKWIGQQSHNYERLAEVIQHFDVCGILEVKGEAAVGALASALEEKTGKEWGYVYGIRTHRPSGSYHEAYAAVWRKDRVELGDGIVSGIWDLEEAFRNDPYMVSFVRGEFDFCLLLVHTRWSDDVEGTRAEEVAMVAEHILWMSEFLGEGDFILAGDFNYSGTSSEMIAMADAAGFVRIDPNHKSTFKSNYSGYASPYDHMYINNGETTEYIDNSCQIMDTTKIVYGSKSVANMKKSKRELSDHLPVYAVFDVSQPDDD